jgi:hypothetical protein
MPQAHPLSVGVFEDDPLLLRLAERSRSAAIQFSRASERMNSDDLALEVARLAACEMWAF